MIVSDFRQTNQSKEKFLKWDFSKPNRNSVGRVAAFILNRSI